MITMPEALLLFALHDDKGTVQASAFLALDHALRGGALAELRLRGYVQTRPNGDLRCHPSPPPPPSERVLTQAWAAMQVAVEPVPTAEALSALQRGLGDIREVLVEELARRGILTATQVERMGLPDDVVHPMADGRQEKALRAAMEEGMALGDAVSPRVGTLVALSVAAHLEEHLFEDPEAARQLADRVADRDAVVRAVREAVARVEGW